MSWYNQTRPPAVRRFFYCAVCKSPYERNTRDQTQQHCGYPSTYLGEGEQGLDKARQMKQKRLVPQFEVMPQQI